MSNNNNNNKYFADFSSTSPRFVAACCVYATVYEEAKCDKVVKGLRTCSSGQNASSAANCTRRGVTARWTFPPLPFDCCIGGSFSPEGETNRRSCAVHADNYLRSLPPYCFLNNNRLLHKLDSLSLSQLGPVTRPPSFFQAPRVLLRSCLSKGCMRIRGYRIRGCCKKES